MSFLTLEFIARHNKHREFLLTIRPLVELTRKEPGCRNFRSFHDTQDQVAYLLVSDWESSEHMDQYLGSDLFQVLLGTASLLREPPKVRINGYPRKGAEVRAMEE